MKGYIGITDRITRVLISALIAFFNFVIEITGLPGIILIAVAAVPGITGFIGFIPNCFLFDLKLIKNKMN